MYTLTKEIYFCYGHRLLDYRGKCAHLHGHNGKVQIELEARTLDKRSMVYDFGDVKQILQDWIDRELDHKIILRRDDPVAAQLKHLGETFLEIDQNPTAEYLARMIFDAAKNLGLPVRRITFWETPSSSASYSE